MHNLKDAETLIGVDKDFRHSALVALLLFSIALLAWHTVAEFMYGIRSIAFGELALALYSAMLFYVVQRRPYSKWLAAAFLIPLLALIVLAMAHPATPPNVFIWIFTMPVLSYSFLGQRFGLLGSTIGAALALLAYLLHYADAPEVLNPLILTNGMICLATIWVAMHLYERNRENTLMELQRLATTDELTGLQNRRQLSKVFTHLAGAADRQNQMLAVIAMDLDHFKQINDRWGHDGGDAVLVHIAGLLRTQLRSSDWAFRIGGEEFCLFLPVGGREGGVIAAETLRRQIEQSPCEFEGHAIPLSASIGVALYPENGRTFGTLLSLADQRMYRAKQQGRNRVIGDDTETALTAPALT